MNAWQRLKGCTVNARNGKRLDAIERAAGGGGKLPFAYLKTEDGKTYHHIENQTEYFARLKKDLAPGARVAILDLRPDAGWLQRWLGHATDAAQIREEMGKAGYAVEDEQDFVERQSFLIFVPADAD